MRHTNKTKQNKTKQNKTNENEKLLNKIQYLLKAPYKIHKSKSAQEKYRLKKYIDINCFHKFHDKLNLISRPDVKEMAVVLLLWYTPNHWGILTDIIQKMIAAKISERPTTIELVRLSNGSVNFPTTTVVTIYNIAPMTQAHVAARVIAFWPSLSFGLPAPQISLPFSNTELSAIWM